MATPAQIEANRLNARKSTGPVTDAGKERASRNALTHGLTAARITAVDESEEVYEVFRRRITAELAPRNVLEAMLAEQVAQTLWKLRRVAQVEGTAIERTLEGMTSYHRQAGCDVSRVMLRDLKESNSALLKVQLYQMRLERTLHRTLAELRTLKKEAVVEVEDDAAASSSVYEEPNRVGHADDRESLPNAGSEVRRRPGSSAEAPAGSGSSAYVRHRREGWDDPIPTHRAGDTQPSVSADQKLIAGPSEAAVVDDQGDHATTKSEKTNPIRDVSHLPAGSDHRAAGNAATPDGTGVPRVHQGKPPTRSAPERPPCLEPEQPPTPCIAAAQLCDTKTSGNVRNSPRSSNRRSGTDFD